MQLKSLLVAAALLSNFASLTYGRAINTPGSGLSSTSPPGTAPTHYELEPRVFKGIRKKLDDKLQAIKDRKKNKGGDDKDAPGGAGASDDVGPLMEVPARYNGPPPLGMNQEPELSAWNNFLDAEPNAQPPPASGGYLMYSGAGISERDTRKAFKAAAAEDPNIGYLKDWDDTYSGQGVLSAWNPYLAATNKKHVYNFAVSFAQARRAANSKSELHMLWSTKDEPFLREKSYFGAVEAGVITGPDSKVNQIWRYNADEVREGEPLPAKILAWDRSIHAPVGKKISEIDWRIDPKGEGASEDVLTTPPPKVPGT